MLKRKAIQSVLDLKRYDVIHYHNISLLGPEVLGMNSCHGPAVKAYTAHEHWLVCPMHVLWKYNKRPCEKPECLSCVVRGNRPPQLWRWTGLLEDSSRHVDLFLSPSKFSAEMHASRGFSGKLTVLPYFVPGRRAADGETKPHHRPYFLFVGRLERIKGLHLLIDVWKDDAGFDLLVAGNGQDRDELRRMAKGNPRIKFLGPQSQESLGPLYRNAVACMVPSVTYETFGMVCVESFVQETPVIAHDMGGVGEVIRESGGGLLYRTREELIDAIHRVAESKELRADLGRRGYQAYKRLWSLEAHIDRYFELLGGAASKKFQSIPWETRTASAAVPAQRS
jgi:glycosyltransferase involved in cell wall biosynthesis